MTVDQAAAILGIGRNGVYGALRNGYLAGVKRGREWDITEESVTDYAINHKGRQGQLPKERAVERARIASEGRQKRVEEAIERARAEAWRDTLQIMRTVLESKEGDLAALIPTDVLSTIETLESRVDALERRLQALGNVING